MSLFLLLLVTSVYADINISQTPSPPQTTPPEPPIPIPSSTSECDPFVDCIGACCLYSGECELNVYGQCMDDGGVFVGPFTDCEDTSICDPYAGIPCYTVDDCPQPIQDGHYCEVADCWNGVCMNMSVGDILCDDHDPCTIDQCLEPDDEHAINQDAPTCTHSELEDCCRNVDVDCEPPTEACIDVTCVFANQHNITGECVYETLEQCCTCDHDCIDPENLCIVRECKYITEGEHGFDEGVCSGPTEVVCDDPDPYNRCLVAQCNHTTGLCDEQILGPDECPGACCFDDGSCSDTDMMDEQWCEEDGGRFGGINTTCNDPGICDTGAPTPPPRECDCHEDCEELVELESKCQFTQCDIESGQCLVLNKTCPGDGPCILGVCDENTGQCDQEVQWDCCTESSLEFCSNSGESCSEMQCHYIIDGVGQCVEVRLAEPPDCCESNSECQFGNLCSAAYCNHQTHECVGVGEEVICPPEVDGDECTEPACNPSNGECEETLLPDAVKCPGACCLDNSCENLDYFECRDAGGQWEGSDVFCGIGVCGETASPTSAPTQSPTAFGQPTSAPTQTDSPTSAPTSSPTEMPTSSPTSSPTEACENYFVNATFDGQPDIEDSTRTNFTLTVNDFCQIANITVLLDIDHTWTGDLSPITLYRNNSSIRLIDSSLIGSSDGCGEDDIFALFYDNAPNGPIDLNTVEDGGDCPPRGDFIPVDPFTTLFGQNSIGTWILEIRDRLAIDTGFILNWTMIFECECGVPTPAPTIPPPTQMPTPMPTVCFREQFNVSFASSPVVISPPAETTVTIDVQENCTIYDVNVYTETYIETYQTLYQISLTHDQDTVIVMNNTGFSEYSYGCGLFGNARIWYDDDVGTPPLNYSEECEGEYYPDLSDRYQSYELLSLFDGQYSAGQWNLTLFSQMDGSHFLILEDWALEITCDCVETSSPTPAPPSPSPTTAAPTVPPPTSSPTTAAPTVPPPTLAPTPFPTEACLEQLAVEYSPVPQNISDADNMTTQPVTTEFTLEILDECIIDNMLVFLEIDHTFVSDLQPIRLSNDVFEIILVDSGLTGGCNTRNDTIPNMMVVFDDESVNNPINYTIVCPPIGDFQSFEPLATFYGLNAVGNWTLAITDRAPPDDGLLIGWSIEFLCCPAPPPTPAPTPCADYFIEAYSPVPAPIHGFGQTAFQGEVLTECTIADLEVLVVIYHPLVGNMTRISLSNGVHAIDLINSQSADCANKFQLAVLFDDSSTSPPIDYTVLCPQPGVLPLTGVKMPEDSLSIFNGQPSSGNWSLEIVGGNVNETITLEQWELRFSCDCAEQPVCQDTLSTALSPVPVDIRPDNLLSTYFHKVRVPCPIASMTVSLNSSHSFVGNLSIAVLTKESGFSILVNTVGDECSQNDMIAVFDDSAGGPITYPADCPPHGTFQPDGDSLTSQFTGLDAEGVWYLALQSGSTELDPAFLDAWQLDFQCNCPTPAPTPGPPTPAPSEQCENYFVQSTFIGDPTLPDDSVTNFTLNVNEFCQIANITVLLNISHTWVGDLTPMTLYRDDSSTVLINSTVTSRTSCGFDDIIVFLYDNAPDGPINLLNNANGGDCPPRGDFIPVDPFASLFGQNAMGTWTLEVTDQFPVDVGSISIWTMFFECQCDAPTPAPTEPCAGTVQASLANTPAFIVDASPINGPTVTDFEINVTEPCIITGMTITLEIDHAWTSDLRKIRVTKESVSSFLIDNGVGQSCDTQNDNIPNMLAVFDDSSANGIVNYNVHCPPIGTFEPVQALNAYTSENALGTWRLHITDHVPQDNGSLIDWTLDFTCSCSPIPEPTPPPTPLLVSSLNSLTCPSDVKPVYIDCNIGTGTTNGETLDCIDNPSVGYSTCGSSLVSCDNNCMNVCVGRSTTKGGTVVQKCIDPSEQTVVEPVPMAIEYADYAHTLCTVLNQCGFADQEVCINEAPSNCVDLNCCSVYNQ